MKKSLVISTIATVLVVVVALTTHHCDLRVVLGKFCFASKRSIYVVDCRRFDPNHTLG